jgi:alkylation response protein AidB-like acyl-CoA dehydrogenase
MSLSPDERDELRASARSLLGRESPSQRVRAVIAEHPGFDRALWQQIVDVGWTSLNVPAEQGGAGGGYSDLSVILLELGRAIVPSPFLASAVLTTAALTLADNDGVVSELLPPLMGGEALGSVAFASCRGSYDPAFLSTAWERTDSRVRLQGTAGFVLDADVSDVLVVAARGPQGDPAVLAIVRGTSGVNVERSPTVDPTRRLFRVSFDDVAVSGDQMLCEPGARAAEVLGQILAVGVIAAACDATGVAERALHGATAYARERVQFDKPIGSFQAVKHHCANMAIAVEASRAAVGAASDALDADRGSWATTADVTSSYVGPACAEACGLALRVHGGIGFTWEHDSHLYLKRAKLDEVLFGTPSWHRRRLAGAMIAAVEGSKEERS